MSENIDLNPAPTAEAEAPEASAPGFIELKVADVQGIGLPGVPVLLATRDAVERRTTGADGIVRIEPAPPGVAGARVDPAAVEAALAREVEPPATVPGLGAPETLHPRDAATAGVWASVRANERHTIVFRRPFARLEIGGGAFGAEDAFVRPSALPDVRTIRDRLAASPRLRVMLFGHGNAVAREEAEKDISERRAEGLFGILAHRVDVWESLYKRERWSLYPDIVRAMLGALGYSVSAATLRQAIIAFQREHPPLVVDDGTLGPAVRAVLFLEYFKLASPEPVPADRFVGAPGAGVPWMGCADFNVARPAAGAPALERRVTLFLFEAPATPRPPCRIGDCGPCHAAAIAPGEGGGDAHCAVYRDLLRWSDPAPPAGFEIALEARGQKTGRVLDGVDLVVERERAEVVARARTDASGRARVEVPGPGAYRVKPVFRAPSPGDRAGGEAAAAPPVAPREEAPLEPRAEAPLESPTVAPLETPLDAEVEAAAAPIGTTTPVEAEVATPAPPVVATAPPPPPPVPPPPRPAPPPPPARDVTPARIEAASEREPADLDLDAPDLDVPPPPPLEPPEHDDP